MSPKLKKKQFTHNIVHFIFIQAANKGYIFLKVIARQKKSYLNSIENLLPVVYILI